MYYIILLNFRLTCFGYLAMEFVDRQILSVSCKKKKMKRNEAVNVKCEDWTILVFLVFFNIHWQVSSLLYCL